MAQYNVFFKTAEGEEDFETGKILVTEYASGLGIDLAFQGFEAELQQLSKQYSKPRGGLLLVYVDGLPAGTAGVRRLDGQTAELKRMFIKPAYRRLGLSAGLLEQCLLMAQQLGYAAIRLDTLATMAPAIALYRRYGFYTIPAYCYNPFEDAVYMEKRL